ERHEEPSIRSTNSPAATRSELADRVVEAMALFQKALRFRRLYLTTHEFYQGALVELHERLSAALALEGDEIRIDVGPRSFKLDPEARQDGDEDRSSGPLDVRKLTAGVEAIVARLVTAAGEAAVREADASAGGLVRRLAIGERDARELERSGGLTAIDGRAGA